MYGKLDYVRDKVAGYFNHLIEIGVAGIRIDAAKHMWPEVGYLTSESSYCFYIARLVKNLYPMLLLFFQDISAILSRLNDLPTDQGFLAGSKFYVFQEVIDQSDE